MAPAARLETRFTREFGIAHPVMCGGMHYVTYAELCAAVSNAGGLGFLTAITQPTPEALRAEIRKTRTLTKKPFGVNISFLPAANPPDYNAYIKVLHEEKITIVETAGNNPAEYIEKMVKGGCTVIHKCTTIRHAETAVKAGATWISMDGFECAGHPGMADTGGLVLFAMAAEAFNARGIKWIASGGIGNGAQLAACLALGADGVNMGTRFMATTEAPIHANIKQALVDSDNTNTRLILRSLKNTERVFDNAMARQAAEAEAAKPGDFGVIRQYIAGSLYRRSFQETGNTQDSVWSCGQVMGLIHNVMPCQQLIDGMVSDAVAAIQKRVAPMIVKAKL
jgi:NAD(P)H-dependent flavin oxidoreductase YrpB (nitropropane dioxygenase family)